MKKALIKKQATVLTLMLALSLAVYLNWRFAKTENEALLVTETLSGQSEAALPAAVDEGAGPVAESVGEPEAAGEQGEKYYGEALFVSSDESAASDYFAKARTTRSQTRDEALDTLQKSLKQTDLTEAEKNALTEQLLSESKAIKLEGTLETLVKAKGFKECVAFVSGGRVKLAVQSSEAGLTAAEAAQLKEIAITESGVTAQDVSIVEIK